MTKRLGTAAVVAVAFAYFTLFLGYGMELEDEGLILAQAQRTLAGELPYLDFDTGYTPGVFVLNAALFRWLGESTVPVRATLAMVNALAVGLLFVLVRPWAGGALAAAAALGYAAFLPVFPGQFASFNIPYPAWYAGLAWLATQAAMDRHLRRGGARWLFLAGVLAGMAGTFKPNAGALAVLACGLALALPAAGNGDPDRHLARLLLGLAALAVLSLPLVDLALSVDNLLFNFGLVACPLVALVIGRLAVARAPLAHRGNLVRGILTVAAGALLPTLPWAIFFFRLLGRERFLQEVLLIGAGAGGLYGTPYPIPITFPGAWAMVAVLLVSALAAAGFLVERRPAAMPWTVLAMGVASLVAGWRFFALARMPEGLSTSVVLQLQVACFVVVPPLAIFAVHRVLRRLRRGPAPALEEVRWLAALAFATCMYLMLYPRMDSMHLMMALPSMVVVAAAATRRMTRAWAVPLGAAPRTLTAVATLIVAALAAIVAGPGIASALARDRFTLAQRRLPVHVESERARDLAAFGRILDHLEARLEPEDRIFGFPAMGLISYTLARPAPVRWEYFFPGRPDHGGEVGVLERLEATRPRFVVTLNRRLGYFFESPIYYFLLRPYVQAHYGLVVRAGRYDVLERRRSDAELPMPIVFDDAPPAPASPAEAIAWMADADRDRRRAAVVHFLAAAATSAGVVELADAWAPDERRRLLLVRSLGEAGDERALALLGRDLESGETSRLRDEVGAALLLLTLRDTLAPYLFAGDGRSFPSASWHGLDLRRLASRMQTRTGRLELGLSASHAFAAAGYREAIPVLEEMLRHRRELDVEVAGTWLRVAAHEALLRLGQPERMCHLIALLAIDRHEVQDMMPSRLITEARRAPEDARRCLARGLEAPSGLTRSVSAYLAAAIPLPALAPELTAATEDDDPKVRRAAAWALARLAAVAGRDRSVN